MTALQTTQPEEERATSWPRVLLGGLPIDLLDLDQALQVITEYARGDGAAQLVVVSANLDHVHHFTDDKTWMFRAPATLAGRQTLCSTESSADLHWLTLLDGVPLVKKANGLTGARWPKLSGSDVIAPILELAVQNRWRVGFLGGTPQTHRELRSIAPLRFPGLIVAGYWSPPRSLLLDPEKSQRLAREISAQRLDILIVGLGKPRQEEWIYSFGAATDAKVFLAFGAVVDFLAGRVRRAPTWVADRGLEWTWRLSQEPRRLARRYLIQGPGAYLKVRRNSTVLDPHKPNRAIQQRHGAPLLSPQRERFITDGQHADVAVIIVTYNSADYIDPLVHSLRREANSLRLRVIVCDNNSDDEVLRRLAKHSDITVISCPENLGYAAAINLGSTEAASTEALLILNPDLEIQPGAIGAMLRRLREPRVGAVTPKIVDAEGATYPSLRREPTVLRAVGSALLGRRVPKHLTIFSETDFRASSYEQAHSVDWATGAVLLIRHSVAKLLGSWNESFFLYSEETEYCRRIRDSGNLVMFEPAATVRHRGAGSGQSNDLAALMAVNRIRYISMHHSRLYTKLFQGGVALSETLRSYDSVHRATLTYVKHESTWPELLATARKDRCVDLVTKHRGSVIIPAHNEAAVIARTLSPLSAAAVSGLIEVVVICNGCSDSTADIARSIPGIRVIEIAEASKTAALNTGDHHAQLWPRLYLDADIEPTLEAVLQVLHELSSGDLLAARPTFRYETEGGSQLIRSYYRARSRLPELRQALWGAGAYAVTESGHQRFRTFPPVIGDDLFVDAQFGVAEKKVVDTAPLIVRTPRRLPDLLAVLRRVNTGNQQVAMNSAPTGSVIAPTTRTTLHNLLKSVRGPRSLLDVSVYAGIAGWTHLSARRAQRFAWERDESSRAPQCS